MNANSDEPDFSAKLLASYPSLPSMGRYFIIDINFLLDYVYAVATFSKTDTLSFPVIKMQVAYLLSAIGQKVSLRFVAANCTCQYRSLDFNKNLADTVRKLEFINNSRDILTCVQNVASEVKKTLESLATSGKQWQYEAK